ncbi:MAG TPA: hypothetical protein VE800_06200 [Actinomycetota bacterium]|jgi:hypothetical protein|nr:hypothetical protein [Actinomycetota bacterium]
MPSASDATAGIAAVAAAIVCVGIAGFQAALSAGAPLGVAAWGGGSTTLATGYRIASGFAVVLWLLAAVVVLERSGSDVSPLAGAFVRWGTWFVFGLSLVGAFLNAASRSPWERFLWAPVSLVLAILVLVVARSDAVPDA